MKPIKLHVYPDVVPGKKVSTRILEGTVEYYLPGTVAKVAAKAKEEGAVVIFHQDAFAADLDLDEFTLLGMYIKYLGSHGITVQVVADKKS